MHNVQAVNSLAVVTEINQRGRALANPLGLFQAPATQVMADGDDAGFDALGNRQRAKEVDAGDQ